MAATAEYSHLSSVQEICTCRPAPILILTLAQHLKVDSVVPRARLVDGAPVRAGVGERRAGLVLSDGLHDGQAHRVDDVNGLQEGPFWSALRCEHAAGRTDEQCAAHHSQRIDVMSPPALALSC